MYKYPITIELLSETIFGNGQSKNGIVNTDILLDEEGFPYYLGKSFKGCLKKSINTILKPFYGKNQKKFNKLVNKLFGFVKKDNTNEQKEGILKFTNFYLDKKITDVFNKYEIKEEEKKDLILSSLTDIRFGIKMGKFGVSESKSLRAARVLKKGLVFNGFVLCSNKLQELELKFLKNGVKSLKNLGVNKSRGKGLVNIKIGEPIQQYSKNIENIKDDFNYLLYEIDLRQPVKIGDSQSQYDYEQTKSYISGSMVRGAIIGKYLKTKGINSNETYKDQNFNDLLKKVCFYDAYPIYQSKDKEYYSFPTPNIFRITKDTDKEDKKDSYKKNDEFLTVFDNNKVKNDPAVIKLKKGDFSYYENNMLYQFNVKKDYRFHHSQEIEKENIFRYESISKGQKFYGVVDVSYIANVNLKKEIYNLLKEGEILYLGGSRTSGYGGTQVSKMETIKDFNELKERMQYFETNDLKDNNKIDIYFLSDSILRNEYHQIVSYFSEEYLNEKLGINIIEDSMDIEITPTILTGYNSTWKSFVPHVYGIEKGSVIRINLSKSKDKINKKFINKFMKYQKGDRKQEGLGRVIISPEFLNVNNIEYRGTNKPYKYERKNSFWHLNNDLIDFIKELRNKAIIDKCIKINTIKVLTNKENLLDISNSRINNIIDVIDRALLSKEDTNPMDEFKNEIKRFEKITQNNERNDKNDKILNLPIFLDKSLKDLLNLSEEKTNEIIKHMLLKELKSDSFIESMIEDSKDKFKKERIILNIIKDILYYSKKSKEDENVG